jgi:hypothetical protein
LFTLRYNVCNYKERFVARQAKIYNNRIAVSWRYVLILIPTEES